ncbi:MAG: dipeptidase [Peptococcaceae bacterium]|nr:dipeptidase [Peptococcaceae bacterium]MDH7524120.1 dipeptidase [Peptococcaceae bacterium]
MKKEWRERYEEMTVVDGHCDTILELYKKKRCFWMENNKGHLDWPRLKKGKVNLQFLAFYIEPAYKPAGSLARVLELLAYFRSLQEENKERLEVVREKNDLRRLGPDVTRFLLAIEGGEAIEGKPNILSILFELGFRCLTITWNQRNSLADGAWENESRGGLTRLGRDVVQEMNRLGMLIDVSHMAEAGFWDVMELSSKPVAATHSCCRALKDHPRNLSDKQLRALAENNGIIGINFFPGFLGDNNVGIEKVVEHLEHAAEVAGVDHVGLGSDFDGINKTPAGLANVACLPDLAERLFKKGWKEENIKKVMGGNFIRVLYEVLPGE